MYLNFSSTLYRFEADVRPRLEAGLSGGKKSRSATRSDCGLCLGLEPESIRRLLPAPVRLPGFSSNIETATLTFFRADYFLPLSLLNAPPNAKLEISPLNVSLKLEARVRFTKNYSLSVGTGFENRKISYSIPTNEETPRLLKRICSELGVYHRSLFSNISDLQQTISSSG